jgi:hypothetical protein
VFGRRVPASKLDVGLGVNDDGPAFPFWFLAIGFGHGRGRGRGGTGSTMLPLLVGFETLALGSRRRGCVRNVGGGFERSQLGFAVLALRPRRHG